jgi:hypothetical protein
MKAMVRTTDTLIIETQLPPNPTNAAVPPSIPGRQDPLVLSYLALRKAVGIIGFALPFVLALVNMILLRRVAVERRVAQLLISSIPDTVGAPSFAYFAKGGNRECLRR